MIGVCRSVAITGSTEVGAELNQQSAATIKKLGSEPAILNGFPYSRNRFFDSKVGMVIVDRATERSERSVLHLSGQAEGLLGRCYWPAAVKTVTPALSNLARSSSTGSLTHNSISALSSCPFAIAAAISPLNKRGQTAYGGLITRGTVFTWTCRPAPNRDRRL
jgi:hypothetical protein